MHPFNYQTTEMGREGSNWWIEIDSCGQRKTITQEPQSSSSFRNTCKGSFKIVRGAQKDSGTARALCFWLLLFPEPLDSSVACVRAEPPVTESSYCFRALKQSKDFFSCIAFPVCSLWLQRMVVWVKDFFLPPCMRIAGNVQVGSRFVASRLFLKFFEAERCRGHGYP